MDKTADPSRNTAGIFATNQMDEATRRKEDESTQASATRLAVEAGNLGNAILRRWLPALRRDAPKRPTPMAIAMTPSVARGLLDQTLRESEQALMPRRAWS